MVRRMSQEVKPSLLLDLRIGRLLYFLSAAPQSAQWMWVKNSSTLNNTVKFSANFSNVTVSSHCHKVHDEHRIFARV